jgi:AcrR family transcriptional regulator
VHSAVEVLRRDGFAAATARTIAARADCNQALVFYHFGSVANLLLAALDEVSAQRRVRYEQLVEGISDAADLVEVAVRVFEEDLDTGDAALLVELMAGASSTPGLGAVVKARVVPWTSFAETALRSVFGESVLGALGVEEAAHLVVALYVGLELLSHLDGDRSTALALFDKARRLAPLARPATTGSLGPSGGGMPL